MRFLKSSRIGPREIALVLALAIVGQWFGAQLYAGETIEILGSKSGFLRHDERTDLLAAVDTGQTQTDFIRRITLPANDVVYSPTTKLLYASVPSSSGSNGNSITTIDPTTGALNNSTFVGSEPNKLALSDDGHTLYTSLDGAFAICRFDVLSQTSDLQFSVGQDSFLGRYSVNDLAVAPGNPNLVAVARSYAGFSPSEAGVAAFDNGVQRPKTGPGHIEGSDFLAFSALASKLYGGGYYGGLKTMTIDSSGVTVDSTAPFNVGARIQFDNGLIYSSAGQVINPDTSTLLGTFSGAASYAFVSDSAVGRAYYLTADSFGGGPTFTLKAFDINTFLPVGSMTITGVTGSPTTLIRWGSNGLAFTTGNQLYLIQTSLIPSSDPIPTPTPTPSVTPTPSPTPVAAFIKRLTLDTNDLIYNQPTQMLYASVPSSSGSNGNSITAIDPITGTIGNAVFVGSEPTKLAPADDGQTLYVGLDGAGAVRRFNMASQTSGQQFSLGLADFFGVYSMSDLAVAPGSPDLVAVARQYRDVSPSEAGVAVFDNGTQRPQTGPGHIEASDFLAFSASASKLYGGGYYSGLSTMTIDAGGVTVTSRIPFNVGGPIKFNNGLVYSSSGQVINPDTGTLVGTFSGIGFGAFNPVMAIDSGNSRIFFLTSDFSSAQIRAYDINTFLPLGSLPIQGMIGTPSSLVRWGTNGLAFRTSNKQVFIIQTALVDPSEPVATPTPTPSPSPSPSPAYIPTFVRALSLPANGLVFSQATQSLYASVPSSAGASGNSITKINPQTGDIGPSVFIGSEPNKLALSTDGQTLYANLDGANAIRRFDIPSLSPALQFSTSSEPPTDMEVVPGSPQSLAVSRGGGGVVIYDDGVPRPNTGTGGAYAIGPIEFGASPETLYGYDNFSSGFELVKFSVDNSGVTSASVTNNLVTGFNSGLRFANGLLYSGSRVVDPEAKRLIGTFQGIGFPNAFTVDSSNSRLFVVSSNGVDLVLSAFDINTFLLIGSMRLPGISTIPVNLVRWGVNGLAFNTVNGPGLPGAPNESQVYVLQSALVSAAAPIPAGVQFNSAKYFATEFDNLNVTVLRTGDVSSSMSVDYATVNGTAIAGVDYQAVSGTLNFGAGELSKIISIPIIHDNLYEAGSETFSITLSNATGGGVISSPGPSVITIVDSDFMPSISVTPGAQTAEGQSGTRNFPISVTLSNPTVQTVTVDYTTTDGTATAGGDYVASSGTLTFPPGTTSAVINVTVNGDTAVESNETFLVTLSNASNVSYISIMQVVATILNDDTTLQFSSAGFQVSEGASSASITVTRSGYTLVASSVDYQTDDNFNFVECNVNNGQANQRCDYIPTVGRLSFAPNETNKTFSIPIVDDAQVEGNETLNVSLSSPGAGTLGAQNTFTLTITDNDTNVSTNRLLVAQLNGAQETPPNNSTGTGSGTLLLSNDETTAQVNLNFSGLSSTQTGAHIHGPAPVGFPGPIVFPLSNGPVNNQSINLTATQVAQLKAGLFYFNIHTSNFADGEIRGQILANPLENARFFVRQQYYDFQNRVPDQGGFDFWTNEITSCGANLECITARRTRVADAFFFEPEFQQTGSYVFRLYRAAFGNSQPRFNPEVPQLPSYEPFIQDRARVIGGGDLPAKQLALANAFVQRTEFLQKYSASLSGAEFVDALLATILSDSGANLSSQRDTLIAHFNSGGRGLVLFHLANDYWNSCGQASAPCVPSGFGSTVDNRPFLDAEYNRGFVATMYFGFLRRDADIGGYNFWLGQVNSFPLRSPVGQHRMVCGALITSQEYQQRFNVYFTRTDAECGAIQ